MAECNCGCGCDDCTCNEPTLNYTVKEINDILADGIINASVRYSNCKGTYIPLTLSEALMLVPDKEKQVTKIITLMNKEEEPQPEIWMFKGKSVMDWLNPEYWSNIPIPTVSGLSKYITSASVKGVEVTDKAYLRQDNVIYFEYEPLPLRSSYGFKVEWESQPLANTPVIANVTLETTYIGQNGLDRVRILFGVDKKPDNSQVMISAVDSMGNKWDFIDQGYWGPPSGFNIPVEYIATTITTLTFTQSGEYELFCKLISVDSGLVQTEQVVTVYVN